jgi:hypothetical protein
MTSSVFGPARPDTCDLMAASRRSMSAAVAPAAGAPIRAPSNRSVRVTSEIAVRVLKADSSARELLQFALRPQHHQVGPQRQHSFDVRIEKPPTCDGSRPREESGRSC